MPPQGGLASYGTAPYIRSFPTLFVAIVLLLAPAWLRAQDAPAERTGTATITGVVVAEPTGDLLDAASVLLWSAEDSVLVAQTVTNAEGAFSLESIAAGEYYLRLVHLYGVVTTETFDLVDAETRKLGRLQLPIEVVALAPIEVSAERVPVTFEADRTSYIVGLMPGAEGASVTEVIRSMPEMTVDIDGRVKRRGNEPAIYINDRPAPMSREAVAAFLEQFPADYIQKIEVIDNPSARYGAEGTGGIINIVLKQGVDLGMSGSVLVNAGTRGSIGAGARGTFQRDAWSVNGQAFMNRFDSESNRFDLRQNLIAEPAFLRQESWSDRSGLSGNVNVNARYQPSERVRFFAQGMINPSSNSSTGISTTTHMDDAEAPILVYDRTSEHDSRNLSAGVTTGFEYQWRPHAHTLKVDLQLERGGRSMESREEIASDSLLADGTLVPARLTRVEEDDPDRTTSLDVDYTRPWGEGGRIELGVRSRWNDGDRDRMLLTSDDSLAAAEAERSRQEFRQEQHTYSAYTTLQRQVGNLGIQFGLRAESFRLRFATDGATPLSRRFLDLFPSASVMIRLDPARHLRLSYSRRINRPHAAVLDPTDRSTDPLNRVVGNPDIGPQYTDQLGLNANWSSTLGNLGLAVHYQKTRNEWTAITTVDDQGVSTSTQQNLASSASYGASLTYALQRMDGWGGHLSLNGMRHVRDAANLADHYSGSSFRWAANAGVSARLFAGFGAEGMFAYTPPIDLPQGQRSEANYRADFGVRYRLLDNRASIHLSLQDPFGLTESSSRMQDVSYILIAQSRESTRSAQLRMSYRLGGPGGMRGGRRGPMRSPGPPR